MKFDLLSSVGVAIVGAIIGFIAINAIVPSLQDYPIKTIDPSTDGGYNYADYSEPNDEVFNYDALNPTVEVYIGECEEYDANGACKQVTTTDLDTEDIENLEDTETEEGTEENLETDVDFETNGQENG